MNSVFARIHQARIHPIWLICVLSSLWSCTPDTPRATSAPAATAPAASVDIEIKQPKPYPFRFIAYGDFRFAEHASYGWKVIADADARQEVMNQVAKESPAFLVVTGDFVFRGFHDDDWKYWHKAIQPLRDGGVPILPAIGNHELGPFPPKIWGGLALREIAHLAEPIIASMGLANYFKEFPEIAKKPWYSARYANCYFLVLDSEADDARNPNQMQWLTAQFAAIPPDIDYIFVVLHRPPYTDLTDPVHNPQPMQLELRAMLEERQKTTRARILVLAGHVHNYERFEHGGVEYIVSGGGGAAPPTQPFPRSADDLYQNGKQDPLNQALYHYGVFSVDHSKLSFHMMKLVRNGKAVTFEEKDSFELNVPAPAHAGP